MGLGKLGFATQFSLYAVKESNTPLSIQSHLKKRLFTEMITDDQQFAPFCLNLVKQYIFHH